MEKTLLDYAEEFLKNGTEASFNDIWEYVVNNAFSSEEREEAKKIVARFYTNLSLDGRFVPLENNMWDLRARKKFDEIKRDWKEYYPDDDSEIDIDEEDDEQRKYDSIYGDNDEVNDDEDENKSDDDDEFDDRIESEE